MKELKAVNTPSLFFMGNMARDLKLMKDGKAVDASERFMYREQPIDFEIDERSGSGRRYASFFL
jgi:hypothetical protein